MSSFANAIGSFSHTCFPPCPRSSYSSAKNGDTWNYNADYPGYTQIGIAIAPHWSGPYTVRPKPIFANMNEDPYIYRDTRGGFHAGV